ncbi:MAG TPA: hypothetical protein VK155_06475 [Bacteroidales bacterium]|nr:hypothetical protein [Bacteroidales bacterium]
MNFAQIPGQKDIIAKLIRTVKEGKVSHAQLFAGPEGNGGLALALAYARFISCENPSENDSCGTCRSCVKYDKLIHPDLHLVFPVVKTKKFQEPVSDNYIEAWREMVVRSPFFSLNKWLASLETENLQGMIYTFEAAEIIRKLNLKSFESDYKIMIIWLPEKMQAVTSNKLLKLIEEPPDKTIFILVSEEPGRIIPTILSRCQLLKIPGFAGKDIENYLAAKYSLDKTRASDIARVANGNICRASDLSENQDSSNVKLDKFRELMRLAYKGDVIPLQGLTEEIASWKREEQKSFIMFSLRIFRENLMMTLGQPDGMVYLSAEEKAFSGKFHPFINEKNVERLSEEFGLACSHIEANASSKIVFLDLALKVARLIR